MQPDRLQEPADFSHPEFRSRYPGLNFKGTGKALSAAWKMTAFGILVALLLVGGFRLGDYLDKRAATTPLFTLLIPFMAMVAVFVNFYAWYQRFQEKYENDEGTDGEKPGSESGRHG